MVNIMAIALVATNWVANDWETIAEYGRTKYEWLKRWRRDLDTVELLSPDRRIVDTVTYSNTSPDVPIFF